MWPRVLVMRWLRAGINIDVFRAVSPTKFKRFVSTRSIFVDHFLNVLPLRSSPQGLLLLRLHLLHKSIMVWFKLGSHGWKVNVLTTRPCALTHPSIHPSIHTYRHVWSLINYYGLIMKKKEKNIYSTNIFKSNF